MFIQETQRILDAFQDRYMRLDLEGGPDGEYFQTRSFVDPADGLVKMDFSFKEPGMESYTLRAWFDTTPWNEFHVICTDTASSCIDFAEEHGLTADDISYLRFGKHCCEQK